MIVKGRPRRDGLQLAAYLLKTGKNELAETVDLIGVVGSNLYEALNEMDALALACNGKLGLYHASINPDPAQRPLTEAEEARAVEILAEELGFAGQPRAVVAHVYEGRRHLHIVFSRVDQERGRLISSSHNFRKHEAAAARISAELGLQHQPGPHIGGPAADDPRPDEDEQQQAGRSGDSAISAYEIIRAAWRSTGSAAGFVAAARAAGYELAQGRRGLGLLDAAGQFYLLARIVGRKAAVDARFEAYDLTETPIYDTPKRADAIRVSLGMPSTAPENSQVTAVAVMDRLSKMHSTFTAYDIEAEAREALCRERGFKSAGALFGKKALAADAETAARADLQPDEIAALAERHRLRKAVAAAAKWLAADALKLPDIMPLFTFDSADHAKRQGSEIYTTRAARADEEAALRAASAVAASPHRIGKRHIAAAESGSTLNEGQRAAYLHAMEAQGLALIEGRAGTGKSYTARLIVDAHRRAGYKVTALAPTHAVARDQKADLGAGGTLASWLVAYRAGRIKLTRKSLLLLDEAAMVSTADLRAMLDAAAKSGAKVVLMGDAAQFKSIERGGIFRHFAQLFGSAEIADVVRQKEDWQRKAAAAMAQRRVSEALAAWRDAGAIKWHEQETDSIKALVDKWAADTAAAPGKSRFVLAYTNEHVDALNAAIRDVRRARGELGAEIEIETKHGRAAFAVGDEIMITASDRQIGVTNGETGRVVAVDAAAGELMIDIAGRLIKWPPAGGGLRHGYAGTLYKGQGKTFDQTYLLHSDGMRHAAGYVALTRHREDVTLFATLPPLEQESPYKIGERSRGRLWHAQQAWESEAGRMAHLAWQYSRDNGAECSLGYATEPMAREILASDAPSDRPRHSWAAAVVARAEAWAQRVAAGLFAFAPQRRKKKADKSV